MDWLYMQKWLYKMAMVLIIIGALNWFSIGVAGFNAVERLLGRGTIYSRAIYIIVGLSALAIMFNRDTYLPFLGEAVLPCSMIPEHEPENADTTMKVENLPVGAKVLYWAAEPATDKLKEVNDWRKAYLKFMNAGVTRVGSDGVATLRVRKPQPYRVPWRGQIEPHIHFRICGDDGLVSRIKTIYVADGRVEGFED